VHDFFDIVGLSRSAPPVEVRRVCARLIRRAHPDFDHRRGPLAAPETATSNVFSTSGRRDVAVDFVNMAALLDGMQASFFRSDPPRSC
jgi:hypothetical protein